MPREMNPFSLRYIIVVAKVPLSLTLAYSMKGSTYKAPNFRGDTRPLNIQVCKLLHCVR